MVHDLKCRVIDLKIGFGGKLQSDEVVLYNKGDKEGPDHREAARATSASQNLANDASK